MQHMNNTTSTSVADIRNHTRREPILSEVLCYMNSSWPSTCISTALTPYYKRQHELSIESYCILWGPRVIIPISLRKSVPKELHKCHPGIPRIKNLARSYFWWPYLDSDIESVVKECTTKTQITIRSPITSMGVAKCILRSRLHIDYAGPIHNQMMLIIVNSHSKWIDVHVTKSSNASVTIEKLMSTFATHGLPHTIVSDNGPCFVSSDFELFNKMNGIRHIKVSPHHPASNGLAVLAVQTVKTYISKMKGGNLQLKVTRFLSRYSNTPQTTTGISPSQFQMKRQIRPRLDLLNPILTKKVLDEQNKQKMHHDYHARDRTFDIGDPVFCQHYGRGDKLIPGHIIVKSGPVSFQNKLNDGRNMKRHQDQTRHRH